MITCKITGRRRLSEVEGKGLCLPQEQTSRETHYSLLYLLNVKLKLFVLYLVHFMSCFSYIFIEQPYKAATTGIA